MSSAAHRLAFVTPTYFSSASVVGGGERYPLNLARGVVKASGGRAHQLLTHTCEAAILFAALQDKPVFGTDLGVFRCWSGLYGLPPPGEPAATGSAPRTPVPQRPL